MQIKRQEIIRGLEKLGEVYQGRKHQKCRVTVDGLVVAAFTIPSDDDFTDTLIGFVAKPLRLPNRPFGEVCACSKDATWYRAYLIQKNLL